MTWDSSLFNSAVWPLLIPTMLNVSTGSSLTFVSVAMTSFFSDLNWWNVQGNYHKAADRLQVCQCSYVQLSLSPFHLDPVPSQPIPLTVIAMHPLLWPPPFSIKSDIYCWSPLPRALMDYLSPAYLSSFRQHWLARSHVLSASDAHFHHSLETASNAWFACLHAVPHADGSGNTRHWQ